MVELGFSDNDLDEKFHNMTELAMEDPPIQIVIDNQGTPSLELAFPFYILWTCSHAHTMVQRKVLDDNEWAGWLQWMDEKLFSKGGHKGNMETSRAR